MPDHGNNWFGNEPENGIPMWFILAVAGVVLVLLFLWFAQHGRL